MSHVIVGRGRDCHLIVNEPSVSTHHARLSWSNGLILVEDLASANGTFAAGKRLSQALIRPGDEVLLGNASLPWTRKELRGFLRLGAVGTQLAVPVSKSRRIARIVGRLLAAAVFGTGVVVLVMTLGSDGTESIGTRLANIPRALQTVAVLQSTTSPHEAYIRANVSNRVGAAMDPMDPITRDAAVQLAARRQGEFRVEQVAAIWSDIRTRWRYVNDPLGSDYFARASETITNNYAGDCDDFAIALAAMVGAIGGDSRVIFMEGPRGGHAYAEVCIRDLPTTVAAKLATYYGRAWAQYTAGRPGHIAYRRSETCPVWLNLDWFASVPGGDYAQESWAVAIYHDGHTETLANDTAPAAAAHAGVAPVTLPTPRPAH